MGRYCGQTALRQITEGFFRRHTYEKSLFRKEQARLLSDSRAVILAFNPRLSARI